MSDQIWWYATRAAGLMTWATAMTSVALGLSMSLASAKAATPTGPLSRVLRRVVPTTPWILDLHRFVGALSVVFLAIHMITLWADSFVHFGLAELFVPFASGWRPLAVAFGVVSAWLLAGVEASSLVKKWLPERLWHGVHLSAYIVAIFGTVHAVMAGSDVGNPIVAGIGLFLLAIVVGLTIVRIAVVRRGTPAEDAARHEAMLATARAVNRKPAPVEQVQEQVQEQAQEQPQPEMSPALAALLGAPDEREPGG